ncbi:MAG: sensor histidine kinase [Actinomycetota bacterium]
MDTFVWVMIALISVILGFLLGRVALRATLDSPVTEQPRSPRRGVSADDVLEQMTDGIVLLNESGMPSLANPAARRFLALPEASLPPTLQSDEIASLSRRASVEGLIVESVLRRETGQSLRLTAVPLEDPAGVVLFLRDVTDELVTQQVRRQFVANASHELKTPVASLQALAEAIREALPEDLPSASRFAQRITIESERLSSLIQRLLDLSKLEDPTGFSIETVDLSQVARRESDLLQSAASDKGLDFQIDVAKAIHVEGDGEHLGLMIRNLLDNALRYTPAGGSVRLSLTAENGTATIRVADTGIGIPLQAQARVFERFFRADPDRSRESGGTGLGLAIVRHVAELHGGHVTLSSELGEGSTFTVKLPVPDNKIESAPGTMQ